MGRWHQKNNKKTTTVLQHRRRSTSNFKTTFERWLLRLLWRKRDLSKCLQLVSILSHCKKNWDFICDFLSYVMYFVRVQYEWLNIIHGSNWTQTTESSTTVSLTEPVSFLVPHEAWLKTILEQEVVGQPHSWTETDSLLSVSSFPCRWSKHGGALYMSA